MFPSTVRICQPTPRGMQMARRWQVLRWSAIIRSAYSSTPTILCIPPTTLTTAFGYGRAVAAYQREIFQVVSTTVKVFSSVAMVMSMLITGVLGVALTNGIRVGRWGIAWWMLLTRAPAFLSTSTILCIVPCFWKIKSSKLHSVPASTRM